ncbi:MAG: hypothetical protein F4X83_01700, partial [Chloroflexi bacterium]|nr:hypothetical protein [Chloroflexota bacterium]
MKRIAILFAIALFLLLPTSVAAADCQIVLGFKTLRDLIGHDIVGECLEDQRYAANGNSEQQTTGGLLVWRKADNWTAFTDGYRTWINGPNGLEQRLNTERFLWEIELPFAQTSAVRGVPGDLWADVIIGQPDFSQITDDQVVPYKVFNPGGVIVDRSVSPGRAYIWDAGNSRILGVDLSKCYAGSGPCSADIVLGQPSLFD